MYMYSDNNEKDDIILHDCRADGISLEGKILRLRFSDGFFIGENNKQNPYGKILGTDEAEIRFDLFYKNPEVSVTAHVFTEENDKTIREDLSLNELMEMIGSGAELEFLSSYRCYKEYLFKCRLWFREEPYDKECELIISADSITYCWNRICEDKEW